MQFDQGLGDGEAGARALMALGQLAFDLFERPAELGQRILGNADAAVGDAEHDTVAREARPRTVMRPPAGVNLTAFDKRLSATCLTARRSARRRRSDDIRDVTSSRFSWAREETTRMDSAEQRIEIEVLEVETDAAGLDLRHIENVVDDVEQILAAAVNVAAIFAVFLGAERAEHAGSMISENR